MTFIPLNNLIGNSLKKAGIYKQVISALIIEEFGKIVAEIFGPHHAKKAKALYYKDKILTVACLSSILAQELKLRENKILQKINEGKDAKIVEKIRFLT